MMSGATIRIRVRPRARRNEIAGERDGALLVNVTAPPHEDKANDAVRKLIAKHAGVAQSRVSIARGTRGRDKLIRVEGLSEPALHRALGL
jgi:uncharacterized protein (TIGR00251 family)